MVMEYIYWGDRLTRPNGKCIRGRNGNMLVEFDDVGKCVVFERLLRKIKKNSRK